MRAGDFVVFPTRGPGGKVAVLLELVTAIYPGLDPATTCLGFSEEDFVEIAVPFDEVLNDWFAHYDTTEPVKRKRAKAKTKFKPKLVAVK